MSHSPERGVARDPVLPEELRNNGDLPNVALEKQLKATSLARLEAVQKTLPSQVQVCRRLCETQAHEGFLILESHEKLTDIIQSLAGKLTEDLAPHFSKLVNCYNKFYSQYAGNLGVWNSIVEGNLIVLPGTLTAPAEFSALCKINAVVLNAQYQFMAPLLEEVQNATATLCDEISKMRGKVNTHTQITETKALENTAKEIEILQARLADLKKRHHNAKVGTLYMKMNQDNQARIQEFFSHRLEHLQHQLYQVEGWLTECAHLNGSETTVSEQSRKLFFVMSRKSKTDTVTTDRDVSELKLLRESLLEQVAEAQKVLTGAAGNFRATCESLETDVAGLELDIEKSSQVLRDLRLQYDASFTRYLTNTLTVCMSPEASAQFAGLIIALKFLMVTISYEVSKMDTTTQRIQAVLENAQLSPATIIQSIYHMFAFPIKYSIMTTGSFGIATDPMYERSYLKFTNNNERTFEAVLKNAPARIIQQKEDEMAEDAFERAAANLYGY